MIYTLIVDQIFRIAWSEWFGDTRQVSPNHQS